MEMIYPYTNAWLITAKLSIKKTINFDLLEKTINIIMRNNEILRTNIVLEHGENKQSIKPYEYKKIKLISVTQTKTVDYYHEFFDEEKISVYSNDLCEFLMLKAHDECGYMIRIHHIICDGLGLFKLINEISETYQSFLNKDENKIEHYKNDYFNFFINDRNYLTSERYKKDRQFWLEKYRNIPDFTEFEQHNPLITQTLAQRKILDMDQSLYLNVKEFCKKNNISIFNLCLSSLAILLNKITHKQDLVVGTSYANRTSKELKDIIGMTVSTVPLRIEISPMESVITLLQRISKEQQEYLRHQKYPYNQLVQELKEQLGLPELGRLFGVSFVYRPEKLDKMDGLDLDMEIKFNGHEINDMQINVIERINEARIFIQVEYRIQLFNDKFIDSFIKQYIAILEEICRNPNCEINELVKKIVNIQKNDKKKAKYKSMNRFLDRPLLSSLDTKSYDSTIKGVISFNQESLWLVEQFEGKSTKYNIPGHIIFKGNFSVSAYVYALNQIVKRHDILRTYFKVCGNSINQDTQPYEPFELEINTSVTDDSEESLKRVIEEESKHQFELETGPLYYFSLYQLSNHTYFAYLNFHHIIFDGWSGNIFMKELGQFYSFYLSGDKNVLPENVQFQYSDYSYWQKNTWFGSEFPALLDYWKDKLISAHSRKILPYDREPSFETTDIGEVLFGEIPSSSIEMIKSIAIKNNASLYITLLTAYKMLLYFYSNELDIVVGTPVANRNRPEVQNILGYFSNSLVLRTVIEPNQTLDELIVSVKNTVFDALDHQEMPFGKLIEILNPERGTGLTPFFQTWFVLDVKGETNIEGLKVEQNEIWWGHSGKSKWDLTMNLVEAENNEMKVVIEYKTELFSKATIKRILHDYLSVISIIVSDSSRDLRSARDEWDRMVHEYKLLMLNNSKSKKRFNRFK